MRWKNFIPFLIIVAAGTIIYVFFLNIIIEKSIEGLGSKVVGAKVEVGKVRFNLFKLTTRIYDLKITNPKDEWRNIFEAGSIGFALEPAPLLKRKVIIDEMSLEKVKWDTKRKTSGKIAKKKKDVENADDNIEAKPAQPSFTDALLKKTGDSKLFDINKLNSIQRINAIKSDIDTRTNSWQNQFSTRNITAEADALGKTISEVKIGSGMSVADAKAALDKLNQAKASLDKIKQDIDVKKAGFDGDIKAVSGYIKDIDVIKSQDLKGMFGEFMQGVTPQSVGKAVFGSVWINKVNNGLYWVRTSRKYMPKNEKIKPPKRSKGIYIRFPEKFPLPGFLIKKIILSGETPNGIQFSGTILGITNDPPVYGSPMIVDIKGWFPNVSMDKSFAQVKAIIDHTKNESRDEIILLAKNLPMKEMRLGESDYIPNVLTLSSADISMNLVLKEKELDSNINANLNKVSFASTENKEPANEFAKITRSVLSEIGNVSAKGKIYGPLSDLKFEMSSNLDAILSKRFSDIAGARLREEEAKIRAEIDKSVNDGKKEVQAKLDDFKAQGEEKLNSYKKSVDDQLAIVQTKIDEVKKQGELFIDQEKKKKEEELKKSAEQGLKGLLGR